VRSFSVRIQFYRAWRDAAAGPRCRDPDDAGVVNNEIYAEEEQKARPRRIAQLHQQHKMMATLWRSLSDGLGGRPSGE